MSNTDAERWQRAKEFIDLEIEHHQQAIDAGGLGFAEIYAHMLEMDLYKMILDRAESNVPKNP